MKQNGLTSIEIEIINRYQKAIMPFIFKTQYSVYIQELEYMDYKVCNILLSGQVIPRDVYDFVSYENLEFEPQINKDLLDEEALVFYNDFLTIKAIAKRCYEQNQ